MRRIVSIILVMFILSIAAIPAYAITVEDLQKQQKSTQSKINSSKKVLTESKNEKAETSAEITRLDKEIEKTQEELNKICEDIELLEKDIKDAELDISGREEAFEQRKELLKKRVKAMYMNSNTSYIDIVLESKSLTDFAARVKLVSQIFKFDNDLMDDIEKEKDSINYKKEQLEQNKYKCETDRVRMEDKSRSLDVSRTQKEEYVKKLNSDIKQLEKQLDEEVERAKKIGEEIKTLLDRNRKYGKGSMVWPVPAVGKERVTSPFGNRIHPILKKKKMHTGVDIAAPKGKSIVAAKEGKVIKAAYQSGYGNYLVIDHGVKDGVSISTLYAHASKILVKVGDEVKEGQEIAKIGSTGLSTGPHLHFEVRKDNTPVDPKAYLGY